ncbi:MAG: Leucine efflux protein [Actinomycetota bacterium]
MLIPGLDFAVVLRYSATQSRKNAFLVSLGITAGLYVWGFAAVLGIAAILQASAEAFNVLRIVGALYLFWMGSRFIVASLKKNTDVIEVSLDPKQRPFMRGFLSNLLNPKPAVFYMSIFPQFIPADSNHALVGTILVTIHATETMLFFTAMILFIGTLKPFFSNPKVVRYLERMSGFAIVGFGAKLLMEGTVQ